VQAVEGIPGSAMLWHRPLPVVYAERRQLLSIVNSIVLPPAVVQVILP
jgi:hypothetical protein